MATVVLAHLRAVETRQNPIDRHQWKRHLARNLYERGMAFTEVRQLFRLIDWLMTLPKDLEIKFRDELHRYEEEKHMPYVTSVERLAMEEGRDKGLIDALKLQLDLRFGSASAELISDIDKIDDRALLLDLLATIVKGESLEDFRRLLQKHAHH
jgi:hypothetical protein